MAMQAWHDRILIKDLLLRGIIGINDWEREKQQDILINLEIWTDMRAAGRSDDMADSINYRTLTKDVVALVETGAFYLVERLATEIARLCVVAHGGTGWWCGSRSRARCASRARWGSRSSASGRTSRGTAERSGGAGRGGGRRGGRQGASGRG